MKTLELYNTEAVDRLTYPEEDSELTVHSKALSVFTDFKQHQPQVVLYNRKIVDFEKALKKAHVRLKLVIDNDHRFIGVVSLEDLTERRIIQIISEGVPRDELQLSDFMRPRSQLRAFEYHDLENATVGDIINTLKNSGQRHCLVIDKENHEIRGIISASDIARRLQLPIDIADRSSFVEVFKALS